MSQYPSSDKGQKRYLPVGHFARETTFTDNPFHLGSPPLRRRPLASKVTVATPIR